MVPSSNAPTPTRRDWLEGLFAPPIPRRTDILFCMQFVLHAGASGFHIQNNLALAQNNRPSVVRQAGGGEGAWRHIGVIGGASRHPHHFQMGYKRVWSSSSSESNRSNARQNAVPKLGPSTNIGAHSMGIGINQVTAPVTLAVTGSTKNMWLWSFLLACELYLVLVSTRHASGKLNRWNRVSSASLNTTTLGVGPCG